MLASTSFASTYRKTCAVNCGGSTSRIGQKRGPSGDQMLTICGTARISPVYAMFRLALAVAPIPVAQFAIGGGGGGI